MVALEEAARKEISKMNTVMQSLKVVDGKEKDANAVEMKKLIDSYWIDAQHFLEKKQFLEAFEAAVICWAYVDSGLHLGIFHVGEELKKHFTV
jgi:hypothetical protein